MKASEIFGRERLRASRAARTDRRITALDNGRHFNVGVLIPTSGVMGMLGPSAYACARLACETWNELGGVFGREVTLTILNSADPCVQLHNDLDSMIGAGEVQALVNLSTTAMCQHISQIVDARVPLVYTPHFEGRGLPSWVHAIGETPERHLLPAIDWVAQRHKASRWYLLGNDYCWPRVSNQRAIAHLRGQGAQIVAERYVPLGERDFSAEIEHIAQLNPDVVLVSLIGSDGVQMGRAFGRAGLAARIPRLSLCIEENALLGMGADNTEGLYLAAGYFSCMPSDSNGSFKERYHTRFGDRAPTLNALSQSVYEGFVHLRRQALDLPASGARWRSADGPRDRCESLSSVRGQHAAMSDAQRDPIWLAQAEGLGTRLIGSLTGRPATRPSIQ